VNEFDLASEKVVDHETRRKEMEDKNYEYNLLIQELDNNNDHLTIEIRKLEEQYSDLKNEYDYLKEGYDEMVKENSELRNENTKKSEKIDTLENELKDMKNVIAKLTEVRVILNKYFSTHFENFTPHEKKIIQDVHGNLNLEPIMNPSKSNSNDTNNNLKQSSNDIKQINKGDIKIFNE
jgi:predicted nuclease with TOPRIM domain